MLNRLLTTCTFVALGAVPALCQQRVFSPQQGPLRSPTGALLPGGGVAQALGGAFSTPTGPRVAITAVLAPGIYEVVFQNTGTGWEERAILGVPSSPQMPAPLLVGFHGYGNTALDLQINTSFYEEALGRGWYMLAPLGAHKFNFGIGYAQQNVEHVIEWLRDSAAIDGERVYGVGFSMGGGCVTSYAARHLDPTKTMFAAIVNHTGGVSIANTYYNSADTSLLDNVEMFGGSPALFPVAYSRASVVDIDFITDLVDPATDLARNLGHLPVQSWVAVNDPLQYLVVQTDVFHLWLQSLSYQTTQVRKTYTTHSWDTLNEAQICDWFAAKSLSLPGDGLHRVLADRSGRWFHFDIEQESGYEGLTPMRWNAESTINRIFIDKTVGLRRCTVHTQEAGLNPNQVLTVVPGTADPGVEEIALLGYTSAPSTVTRSGLTTPNWTYDPVLEMVVLFEFDAVNYPQWVITP